MREIELVVGQERRLPSAGEIEAAVRRVRLMVSMKGTLAKYPGCTHWHLKRGRERGTLELTLWPAQRRLWLSVQEGRRAGWIAGAAEALVAELARGT